jgi:acetyl esterase/lipase
VVLAQVLRALGVDNDVKEYPGAGHAFLNDHDSAGDPNPVIFVVMGKFAGPSELGDQRRKDRVAGLAGRLAAPVPTGEERSGRAKPGLDAGSRPGPGTAP